MLHTHDEHKCFDVNAGNAPGTHRVRVNLQQQLPMCIPEEELAVRDLNSRLQPLTASRSTWHSTCAQGTPHRALVTAAVGGG